MATGSGSARRPKLLCFQISICLFIGAASVGIDSFKFYSSWASWILRILSAVIALGLARTYAERKNDEKLKESSVRRTLGLQGDNGVPLLHAGRAITLQQRIGRTRPITSLEAQIFALAITSPSTLRPRVTEHYLPERRTVRQQVTVEIQLPKELLDEALEYENAVTADNDGYISGESSTGNSDNNKGGVGQTISNSVGQRQMIIPFPAIIPPKGELNDDLSIHGADEATLSSLSYSEYLELVASILRMLLLKAYCHKDASQLPKAAVKAELVALRCIMQRGLRDAAELAQAVEGLANLKSEAGTPFDGEPLLVATELVRRLANRYAVVASVSCDADGRAILRYERTLIPGLRLADNKPRQRIKWFKDRLSLLLGARPVDLTLSLEGAPTCQSFHLMVICPEGLYLREQKLPRLKMYLASEEKRRNNAHDTSIPPYYRPQQRLGQPYAHFYSRFFPEPLKGENAIEIPKIEVSFLEAPPGSLFRASIGALTSSLLIWLIGYVVSRGGDPGTDAPAVLLAFPAVIAAWLGVETPSRRLLDGTLAARLSLICSAAAALAASGLFMIYKANLPIFHGSMRFPIRISFLGIRQTSWGLLAALSFANAFYVIYFCLLRTWEFKYLSSRRGTQGSIVEEG